MHLCQLIYYEQEYGIDRMKCQIKSRPTVNLAHLQVTLTIDLKIQLELIQNISLRYKNYVYSREAEHFFYRVRQI